MNTILSVYLPVIQTYPIVRVLRRFLFGFIMLAIFLLFSVVFMWAFIHHYYLTFHQVKELMAIAKITIAIIIRTLHSIFG